MSFSQGRTFTEAECMTRAAEALAKRAPPPVPKGGRGVGWGAAGGAKEGEAVDVPVITIRRAVSELGR